MVRRGITVGAALLLLGGCGGGDYGASNEQDPRIRIGNKYHDDLTRLPPDLQRLTMMRAIRDGRYRCQRVSNAGYQEEYRNMRMWVAECDVESKRFAIFLAANGDIQVRDCADAGQLSLPRCAGLPPAPPDTKQVFKEGAADKAFRNGN